MWHNDRKTMIRKAIIVMCVLATVLVVFISWRSRSRPIHTEISLSDRSLIRLYCVEGVVRFFWLSCMEDFSIEYNCTVNNYVTQPGRFPFGSQSAMWEAMRIRLSNGSNHTMMLFKAVEYELMGRSIHSAGHTAFPGGPGRPPLHITLVRTRSWLVATVFTVYPILAFIRGPLRRWRRKKKGLCLTCGYDLTGNESGVCPECGVEVTSE